MDVNTAEPTQAEADAEYPEWKPTDWTSRQRVTALIGLFSLALGCALITWAFKMWGTGSLALDTFIPMGYTLLTLGATLLTSVLWYAYRHARNTTYSETKINEPTFAQGAVPVIAFLAAVTLVFQVIGGILVATVGWEFWREYREVSFGLPTGIAAMILFILGAMSFSLSWIPIRDPSAPASRLAAPATGVRLVFRWMVTLVARGSSIMLWGIVFFSSGMMAKVFDNAPVDLSTPIAISWFGAAFFLVAALVELLPSRTSPDAAPISDVGHVEPGADDTP